MLIMRKASKFIKMFFNGFHTYGKSGNLEQVMKLRKPQSNVSSSGQAKSSGGNGNGSKSFISNKTNSSKKKQKSNGSRLRFRLQTADKESQRTIETQQTLQ